MRSALNVNAAPPTQTFPVWLRATSSAGSHACEGSKVVHEFNYTLNQAIRRNIQNINDIIKMSCLKGFNIHIFFLVGFSAQRPSCDCKLPCEWIEYDVSLSSAQLSRSNIERFALKTPLQLNRTDKHLRKALEARHRCVK